MEARWGRGEAELYIMSVSIFLGFLLSVAKIRTRRVRKILRDFGKFNQCDFRV